MPVVKIIASGDRRKFKILIVDDHPVFRHGLKRLINEEPDLTVCGEASDVDQALEMMRRHHPDLALIDISLNGTNGLVLTRNLRTEFPKTNLVIVSMYRDSLYAERALRAGARGYVTKQEPPESLLLAIRRVLQGDVHVSPAVSSRLLSMLAEGRLREDHSPLDCLSDRELQVFQLIGRGKGTRQIAQELSLSIKTIESYRAHIKEKMNIETASELVQTAIYWIQQEKPS